MVGFWSNVNNFFSSAYNKLETAVTTVYHDLEGGTARVYNDVSHDVDKGIGIVSDAVHTTSKTTNQIATGAVKDVKIALNDTKDTVTSVSHSGERAVKSVSTAGEKAVRSVSTSGQKAITSVSQALPETASNLKYPLMIGGAVALIYMMKK
jgi:hypothetical protein